MKEFEIYPEDIEQLETVKEFDIWLSAIDSVIEIDNLDPLIEHLISVDRPQFVMAALGFKHKYLNNET
tara:strand:- start:171 stop:374 length:204 start_codon:yes stop_codon:yes gene_type:complete